MEMGAFKIGRSDFFLSIHIQRSVSECARSVSLGPERDWSRSSCLARGPNIAYSSMTFQLKIWILGYRLSVAVFWDFLALGARVLWRARPWLPADGDGELNVET